MLEKKALLIHGDRYSISPFILLQVNSSNCKSFLESDTDSNCLHSDAQVGVNLFSFLKEHEPLYLDNIFISGLYSKALLNKIIAFLVNKNLKDFSIIIDHADFNSIYDFLYTAVSSYNGLYFEKLVLDRQSDRMGQCYATMSFSKERVVQDPSTIPVNKNKSLCQSFPVPKPLYSYSECIIRCKQHLIYLGPRQKKMRKEFINP